MLIVDKANGMNPLENLLLQEKSRIPPQSLATKSNEEIRFVEFAHLNLKITVFNDERIPGSSAVWLQKEFCIS